MFLYVFLCATGGPKQTSSGSVYLALGSFAARLKIPRGSCRNPGIAMLFIQGDIVMRMLSKRQLKELVLYSPQHIARLEKAGKFPLRVQLGSNRVGWVEREVLDWLQTRLDSREVPN